MNVNLNRIPEHVRAGVVLALALMAAGAWADVSTDDGEAWMAFERRDKVMSVYGMTLGEHAWLDMLESVWMNSEDISEAAYEAAIYLQGEDDVTIGEVCDAMDEFYSKPKNTHVPLWAAYFLSRGIELWPDYGEER